MENYKELYRYFNPINIHNYFDKKMFMKKIKYLLIMKFLMKVY